MKKKITVNKTDYFIETTVYTNEDYIEVKAYYYEKNHQYENIFYEAVHPYKIFEIVGYTLQKRLEKVIQKAIKRINKYDHEANFLQRTEKEVADIFTIDEHMNL